VPVDVNGLDLNALPHKTVRVRAVYVTPSHQFPTGAVMPAARRYALLDVGMGERRAAPSSSRTTFDGEFAF
jgi:DNA-binding transcriptional MocR family regulator